MEIIKLATAIVLLLLSVCWILVIVVIITGIEDAYSIQMGKEASHKELFSKNQIYQFGTNLFNLFYKKLSYPRFCLSISTLVSIILFASITIGFFGIITNLV
jgi:hypothetical protein